MEWGVWGSVTEGDKPIQEDVLELATPQDICANLLELLGSFLTKGEG